MGRRFLAIGTVLAHAASIKPHSVEMQVGKPRALRFRLGRRWIWGIGSSVLIVAALSFISASWQGSTKAIPPQGAWASIGRSGYMLRLSGSKTIGSLLVPELVTAWLDSIGASDVGETHRTGSDGKEIREWLIRAKLNGNPVVVEVKAYGSRNAFRGSPISEWRRVKLIRPK